MLFIADPHCKMAARTTAAGISPNCHGMQAGQVEWLTRFQDAWSFYEHADSEARADLRETAAQ